mgnify:FL=1
MASKIKVDTLETANGSGTIALSNQLSGMTTASLPALGSAQMPSGSVLQVVSTGTIATASTTSTSFVDSGMTQAITPSSTSSKIRVDVCFVCTIRGSNSALRGGIKILRGSTVIWNSVGTNETWQVRGSPEELNMILSPIVLDSPSSTSAVTYKIQYAVNAGSSGTQTFTLYNNTYGTGMILTEIQG